MVLQFPSRIHYYFPILRYYIIPRLSCMAIATTLPSLHSGTLFTVIVHFVVHFYWSLWFTFVRRAIFSLHGVRATAGSSILCTVPEGPGHSILRPVSFRRCTGFVLLGPPYFHTLHHPEGSMHSVLRISHLRTFRALRASCRNGETPHFIRQI